MDEKSRLWYEFTCSGPGSQGIEMPIPVRALTPEGAAEVLRMLLTHRPDDTLHYTIHVRVEL